MQNISDAGLQCGLALPDFASPQQNQTPAAALNEDISVAEVQQQLDCSHNGRAAGQAGLPAELLRSAKEAPQSGQPPNPMYWYSPLRVCSAAYSRVQMSPIA